jgi:hypothetical protein
VVAAWNRSGTQLPVGTNTSLEGDSVAALVLRKGRSTRMDSYADAPGSFAALLRGSGIIGTTDRVDTLGGTIMISSPPGVAPTSGSI